jgi:photosystem II stability/assembly factor-like uncharacterized protein
MNVIHMTVKNMLVILLLFFSIDNICVATNIKFEILPIPLTTSEQLSKGIKGGEGLQRVLSIVYAPSDISTVYFSSDTTQVWKSIDSGKSWFSINNKYLAKGGRSLFVHPNNHNIVFSAATLGQPIDRVKVKKGIHQGIYRSIDGGEHWALVHETPFYRQETTGALFAIDSNTLIGEYFTIYAGAYNGELLVSKDSGSTWRKTNFAIKSPIVAIQELPSEYGTIIIASEKGLHRYKDNKIQRIGDGLPTWPRSIAVSKDDPSVVYAALGKYGVYISNNSGENFKLSYREIFGGSVNDIEVSPVNSKNAIFIRKGKNGGPYHTSNGGKSWHKYETIHRLGLSNRGDFYFSSPVAFHPTIATTSITSSNGNAKILMSSDGGKSWEYSGSGYRGARLKDVEALSKDRMIFALTDHGLFLTDDGAKTFKAIKISGRGPKSVNSIASSEKTIVITVGSWNKKRVLVSFNEGVTWIDKSIYGKLGNIRVHSESNKIIYVGENISRDGGINWEKIKYEVMSLDQHNNDILYALEKVGKGTQLLLSKDQGRQWEKHGKQLPVERSSVREIANDPFKKSRIYAATGTGIWVLDQQEWYKNAEGQAILSDAFNGKSVSTILPHPKHPGLIFIGKGSQGKGMSNGIFYSVDYGENWQQLPDKEISRSTIWSLNINQYDGAIYAGTSHGIYKIQMSMK